MIRLYNSKLNRSIIRDIKRVCTEREKHLKSMLEILRRDSLVTFAISNNPNLETTKDDTGFITFTNTSQIENYLRDEVKKQIFAIINKLSYYDDYLLKLLFSFLANNDYFFPKDEEFLEMEKEAEKKRLSSSNDTCILEKPPFVLISANDVFQDILDLSEEILENRLDSTFANFYVSTLENYKKVSFKSVGMYIDIIKSESLAHKNTYDYKVCASFHDTFVGNINIIFYYNAAKGVNMSIKNNFGKDVVIEQDNYKPLIITIHEYLVNKAQEYGIHFAPSVVDYDKIFSS